ncbi:hypothetical protein [Kribbella italica]|uniref:Uncharacterized protein n=1 Tax=Kribbella italica TaxID=1540520 RepID=A0A7W9JBM6_9ACTN|nr:hypothetical protein [Kribbella italica]MBB5839182.1 hypothetical protein [Kribbella italica]
MTDPIQSALQQHNTGRVIPFAAPHTLAELLTQHAQAALSLSGADRSAWNGQIVEAGDGILGLAHWDGTLHLDREFILAPLHDLYARAGQSRPTTTLARYRDALLTLLHEQSHFLGPHGSTQEAARAAFRAPGAQALEEGIAEAWSHTHLDAYLRLLSIPHHAPGIGGVSTRPSYQAYVPATLALTSHLDDRGHHPPGSTLTLLNRQTTEGQWPLVTEILYRSTTLPRLVPYTEEPEIRHDLESHLRNAFQSLEILLHAPQALAAHRSHATLHTALTTLDHHLEHLAKVFARPTQSRPPQSPTNTTELTRTPQSPDDTFELTR